MDCQEARAKMFSYLDQELSFQEEEALFEHMSLCHECSYEFSTASATHDLLKNELIPVEPPLDLTKRIMAQIPLPKEQTDENISFALRLKGYILDFGEGWKKAFKSWQFRTAAVTMGLFALVAFGSMSDSWDLRLPQKQTPATDIAHVDRDDPEVPEPIVQTPQDNPVQTPEIPEGDNGEGTGDKTPGKTDPEPVKPNGKDTKVTPDAGQQPTVVVPDRGTNIVELPLAASEETKEEIIRVVSLIENNGQPMSHPVLSEDGKYIHYLYNNAGVEEEWEIELKSGAQPQKVQSNLLLETDGKGNAKTPLPQWLSEMEMMKDAKTKIVAWSPDKKQIAINLDSAGTDYDGLWIAQQDGSALTLVTQEGGGNDLVWSPNRTKIAFTDGADNLFVLYLRENLLIQVLDESTGLADLDYLFWTPDGKELVFEGHNVTEGITGIYRVALP
ncbi:MAG: zf-HC2 domain-containing protein [Bacillota bacterium]